MNYLRVTDLLARHCNLPMVDVPNIAYYDCYDLPYWSVAFNSDITTQLMCGVTFMNGCRWSAYVVLWTTSSGSLKTSTSMRVTA